MSIPLISMMQALNQSWPNFSTWLITLLTYNRCLIPKMKLFLKCFPVERRGPHSHPYLLHHFVLQIITHGMATWSFLSEKTAKFLPLLGPMWKIIFWWMDIWEITCITLWSLQKQYTNHCYFLINLMSEFNFRSLHACHSLRAKWEGSSILLHTLQKPYNFRCWWRKGVGGAPSLISVLCGVRLEGITTGQTGHRFPSSLVDM